jgi:hypothetical protein
MLLKSKVGVSWAHEQGYGPISYFKLMLNKLKVMEDSTFIYIILVA